MKIKEQYNILGLFENNWQIIEHYINVKHNSMRKWDFWKLFFVKQTHIITNHLQSSLKKQQQPNTHGKLSQTIIIMLHQLTGELITMHKLNNQTKNLDKIWTSKHNNGIIMYNKKMREDGEWWYITFYFLCHKIYWI